MKLLLIFSLAVISVLADEDAVLKEFSEGNVKYIGNLYQELLKEKSGNFLVCPLSIQSVFALMNSGAKGNTAKQISTALHIPENEHDVDEVITALYKSVKANDDYILNSANKVYLKESLKINRQYKSRAVEVFRSDIENIDFSNAVKATDAINAWVEEKTHNKIKQLITKDMIGADTVVVLINALFFQGKWLVKFDETFQAPFHLSKEKSVSTTFMKNSGVFRYFHCSQAKATWLELPYKGEEVSLTIVLPDEIDGLSALEEHIGHVLETPKYDDAHFNVTIPKFKIESSFNLVKVLQNLGVVDAFTGAADFSAIIENEDKLVISNVVQKTHIEVTEEGTTASAATGIIVGRTAREYDELNFVADHPFMFYLKHATNGIFFVGRHVEVKEVD